VMDAKTLISPAADWSDGRWLDRVEQSASFLFVHGYITGSQREKVALRLEKQIRAGLDAGEIIATPSTTGGE